MKKFDIDESIASKQYQFEGLKVKTPYELYDGQKQYISYVLVNQKQIIECLVKGKNALVQSPTGTGKTHSLLCSTLSYLHNILPNQQIRIIYTSRTHSQLKQVVTELKKTGYHPKIAILGSKDHTCIHQDLNELNGKSKELQCRLRVRRKNGLFCQYFHHDDHYKKMSAIGDILDLEEIGFKGKTQGFCPYYYGKSAKDVAHLILMPYNYLLDQRLWDEDTNKVTENSVIIFDEAHNIQSTCEQIHELSISLTILAKSLQQISQIRELKLRQLSRNDESQQIKLKTPIEQYEMHASYISLIHTHMQILQLPPEQNGIVMNGAEFLDILQQGTQSGEFGGIKGKIKQLLNSENSIKDDIMYRPFWAIESWFSFLKKVGELLSYEISNQNYKCQIAYQGSDIKLNFLCLDPKVGFKRILELKPRAMVLTSGTLTPLNTWGIQLGIQFAKPLACPHILNKDQVNGCILSKGRSGSKLNFSFENRDKKEIFQSLGEILLEIVSHTPNGIIIFLPSYSLLQKTNLELSNHNYLNKIYQKKMIFFEKKNNGDFKVIIDSFMKEAQKQKGALMFALARGKISEGLDLANQKCRAVVMVGVPYPASRDLKVVSKMKYFDSKSEEKKTLSGNQWYLCETIRCINQSIGRIIRNKNDFGSIYLLDERYKKQEILSQISSWARGSLSIIQKYDDFVFKVKIFHEYLSKKQRKQQNYFVSVKGTTFQKLNPSLNTRLIKGSISETTLKEYQQIDSAAEKQKIKNDGEEVPKEKPETREKILFNRTKKVLLDQKKQCSICRQKTKLIGNKECKHEFCEACWQEWLKKDLRCPFCRVRVRQKYLIK